MIREAPKRKSWFALAEYPVAILMGIWWWIRRPGTKAEATGDHSLFTDCQVEIVDYDEE